MRKSIVETGARTDAVNNQQAIQACIDMVNASGGGTVYVPAGEFRTGGLVLYSQINLHLESGATLLGTGVLADYPKHHLQYFTDKIRNPLTCSMIYAENAHDVSITGQGVIDGGGEAEAFRSYPLQEGPGDWHKPQRPWGLRFYRCQRVTVQGIRLQGSAEWIQHYMDCDDVMLRDLRVFGHRNANNDGLDIDGCRNVIVQGCIIDADDDAISLKSTQFRPCTDILITGCILSSRIRGLHLGSETTGDFKRIRMADCIIRPSLSGESVDPYRSDDCLTAVCVQSVQGARIEDVVIDGLQVEGYMTPLYLRVSPKLGSHPKYPEHDLPMGSIKGFTMTNVRFKGIGRIASSVCGQPESVIERVELSNWELDLPGGGTEADVQAEVPNPEGSGWNGVFGVNLPASVLYARDVKDLGLNRLKVYHQEAEARATIHYERCTAVEQTGIRRHDNGALVER